MNSSIARIVAVTLFAAGSFAHMSTVAAAPAQVKTSTVALAGPGGPQTPIPICPRCGRDGGPSGQ